MSFTLFGSALGSFMTAQPSQQFLGNNEIIFRNLLMIRKTTEKSESDTFSFRSPQDLRAQICNEVE